ncbi:hypothetical protein [Vibrio gallaecicus]|nr:hypothetical protein [Vibrio gallaecicus]MDN3617267.1 hypothetical protein [Vibrio gallaecicus]
MNVADQIVGFRFSSNELRNKATLTTKPKPLYLKHLTQLEMKSLSVVNPP